MHAIPSMLDTPIRFGRPNCLRCEGVGYVEGINQGQAERCPECNPTVTVAKEQDELYEEQAEDWEDDEDEEQDWGEDDWE